jgi:pyruvate/2-oxoglutarate dehydrogenase complex dihydrolipoamide acyltransferase (E2) component
MTTLLRLLAVVACLALPPVVRAAEPEVTLFRIFLLDGSAFVSYGEFVRLADNVIFSMPVGSPEQPRLQVATIRSELVDWTKTDRYAASARYQRYATTRGEEDYLRLNNEVAEVLNTIALSTDRQQALAIAERARQTVAEWPQSHFGYRLDDIREIVSVLDHAILSLRAVSGASSFELALVAMASPPEVEPLLGMPSVREQLDQMLQMATITPTPSERMAFLQAAQALVTEAAARLSESEASIYHGEIERAIRDEMAIEKRYGDLSRRSLDQATRAAQRADSPAIERIVARVRVEDTKLGQQRPQLVEALNASLQGKLADSRHLRLLRDQWALRRETYRQYQRSVGSSLLLLVKSTASLRAIRTLDGPNPEQLVALRSQLSGGAERLERMYTPEYLRDVHERLVGAWRFAENAARARFEAISKADATAAWEASSSAAGALMMLARVQQELTDLLSPPRLH